VVCLVFDREQKKDKKALKDQETTSQDRHEEWREKVHT
jgi:hypothetical protein